MLAPQSTTGVKRKINKLSEKAMQTAKKQISMEHAPMKFAMMIKTPGFTVKKSQFKGRSRKYSHVKSRLFTSTKCHSIYKMHVKNRLKALEDRKDKDKDEYSPIKFRKPSSRKFKHVKSLVGDFIKSDKWVPEYIQKKDKTQQAKNQDQLAEKSKPRGRPKTSKSKSKPKSKVNSTTASRSKATELYVNASQAAAKMLTKAARKASKAFGEVEKASLAAEKASRIVLQNRKSDAMEKPQANKKKRKRDVIPDGQGKTTQAKRKKVQTDGQAKPAPDVSKAAAPEAKRKSTETGVLPFHVPTTATEAPAKGKEASKTSTKATAEITRPPPDAATVEMKAKAVPNVEKALKAKAVPNIQKAVPNLQKANIVPNVGKAKKAMVQPEPVQAKTANTMPPLERDPESVSNEKKAELSLKPNFQRYKTN